MERNGGDSSLAEEKFANMAKDPRWRMVNRTIRQGGNQADALIETLHAVQDSFGFLDRESMEYVASALGVPFSLVYSVATFYHYFTLKPAGEHTCVVCLGTACYIGGSQIILNHIEEQTGIRPGETTGDGRFSLLVARCFGSCGLAPVAAFDAQVTGRLDPQSVLQRIGEWTGHDA